MAARRLPNGSTTTSIEEYTAAWEKLGAVVEAAFPGYKMDAYDPDLRFTKIQDGKYLSWFELPLDAVRALEAGLKQFKLHAEAERGTTLRGREGASHDSDGRS